MKSVALHFKSQQECIIHTSFDCLLNYSSMGTDYHDKQLCDNLKAKYKICLGNGFKLENFNKYL